MNQKLNTVKVLFADSQYNYSTDVSANSTKESVNEYFVGKLFDKGIYPVENMQQCIGVEFTDNNTDINRYKISFTGRLKGAIGIFYKITDTVQAANENDAILALYDKYEHIHQPIVKQTK